MDTCRVCEQEITNDNRFVEKALVFGPCGPGSHLFPGHNNPRICKDCFTYPNVYVDTDRIKENIKNRRDELDQASYEIVAMLPEVCCEHCKDEDNWEAAYLDKNGEYDFDYHGPTCKLKDVTGCTCYAPRLMIDFYSYTEHEWEREAEFIKREKDST